MTNTLDELEALAKAVIQANDDHVEASTFESDNDLIDSLERCVAADDAFERGCRPGVILSIIAETRALREALDRTNSHLWAWAQDHADERTAETDAILFCNGLLLTDQPQEASHDR